MKIRLLPIVSALSCLTALAGKPPPPGLGLKPPPTPEQRAADIQPVAEGELRIRPTFNAVGLVWGSAEERKGLEVAYRPQGGEWQPALPLEWFDEVKNYRGSIVNLEEDTAYEVRLTDGGKTVSSGRFRTWASEVPVARTVVIDPKTFKTPYEIGENGSGTADGWVRYTMPKGAVLRHDSEKLCPAFVVKNAHHVLLDDLTIRGGIHNFVFNLSDSKCVRIRNCDIAGWGRKGYVRYELKGRLFEYRRPDVPINWDSAIIIGAGCEETVVERCYIHDPRNNSNSWFYSHPNGTEAVVMNKPRHSTVIRYNDFVGSDLRRWNDAVEGGGNGHEDGGFNRDADVYGNFMIFCQDDCIELDGGQQNVRCYRNRFEQALSGVSIQGCMVSPVYLFENLFVEMGDEFGLYNPAVKTSGIDLYSNGPAALIFNNTFWGKGLPFNMKWPYVRFDIRNNLFSGPEQRFSFIDSAKEAKMVANTVEFPEGVLAPGIDEGPVKFVDAARGDWTPAAPQAGVPIANFFGGTPVRGAVQPDRPNRSLPYRPVPFDLDRTLVRGITMKGGVLSQETADFTLVCGGKGYRRPFEVKINEAFDWFEVSPSKGVIESGKDIRFTLRLRPERMRDRHDYRGALLVRTDDGYSRPLSLYVETDFVPPFHAEKPGETAIYVDVFKPVNGVKLPVVADARGHQGKVVRFDPTFKGEAVYEVDVPKEGIYYFMAHGFAPTPAHHLGPELVVRLNGDARPEKKVYSRQMAKPYPTWTHLVSGYMFSKKIQELHLKPGRQTISIAPRKREFSFDAIVLTDSPGSFEPR